LARTYSGLFHVPGQGLHHGRYLITSLKHRSVAVCSAAAGPWSAPRSRVLLADRLRQPRAPLYTAECLQNMRVGEFAAGKNAVERLFHLIASGSGDWEALEPLRERGLCLP
jgi:hypothetical protein